MFGAAHKQQSLSTKHLAWQSRNRKLDYPPPRRQVAKIGSAEVNSFENTNFFFRTWRLCAFRLCHNCHFEVKPRNLFFVCGWKHEIPRCARDDRCGAFAHYDTASLAGEISESKGFQLPDHLRKPRIVFVSEHEAVGARHALPLRSPHMSFSVV
jgi:hypothetical protein